MKRIVGLTLALLVLAGCATNRVYNSTTTLTPPLNASVVILPPDVELSLLNAGGNREPRADWTEAATESLYSALEEFFFENGVMPVPYGQDTLSDEDIDIIRQANINLDAIELAQTRGVLPGAREYALSQDLVSNLDKFDADYALFITIRGSYASVGRVFVAAIEQLVTFFPAYTGGAQYRVALFDLRDGQVVWANFDLAALGDLGNPANATPRQWQRSFETLFKDFPL